MEESLTSYSDFEEGEKRGLSRHRMDSLYVTYTFGGADRQEVALNNSSRVPLLPEWRGNLVAATGLVYEGHRILFIAAHDRIHMRRLDISGRSREPGDCGTVESLIVPPCQPPTSLETDEELEQIVNSIFIGVLGLKEALVALDSYGQATIWDCQHLTEPPVVLNVGVSIWSADFGSIRSEEELGKVIPVLAIGSNDHKVRLYDAVNWGLLKVIHSHSHNIPYIALFAHKIASVSIDGKLALCSVTSKVPLFTVSLQQWGWTVKVIKTAELERWSDYAASGKSSLVKKSKRRYLEGSHGFEWEETPSEDSSFDEDLLPAISPSARFIEALGSEECRQMSGVWLEDCGLSPHHQHYHHGQDRCGSLVLDDMCWALGDVEEAEGLSELFNDGCEGDTTCPSRSRQSTYSQDPPDPAESCSDDVTGAAGGSHRVKAIKVDCNEEEDKEGVLEGKNAECSEPESIDVPQMAVESTEFSAPSELSASSKRSASTEPSDSTDSQPNEGDAGEHEEYEYYEYDYEEEDETWDLAEGDDDYNAPFVSDTPIKHLGHDILAVTTGSELFLVDSENGDVLLREPLSTFSGWSPTPFHPLNRFNMSQWIPSLSCLILGNQCGIVLVLHLVLTAAAKIQVNGISLPSRPRAPLAGFTALQLANSNRYCLYILYQDGVVLEADIERDLGRFHLSNLSLHN